MNQAFSKYLLFSLMIFSIPAIAKNNLNNFDILCVEKTAVSSYQDKSFKPESIIPDKDKIVKIHYRMSFGLLSQEVYGDWQKLSVVSTSDNSSIYATSKATFGDVSLTVIHFTNNGIVSTQQKSLNYAGIAWTSEIHFVCSKKSLN